MKNAQKTWLFVSAGPFLQENPLGERERERERERFSSGNRPGDSKKSGFFFHEQKMKNNKKHKGDDFS